MAYAVRCVKCSVHVSSVLFNFCQESLFGVRVKNIGDEHLFRGSLYWALLGYDCSKALSCTVSGVLLRAFDLELLCAA